MCFCYLGSCRLPLGPYAALGPLVWLIGVPCRVNGCSEHVYFCYGGPWACHWDLYWPLALIIAALCKLHRFEIDGIRSGYRIEPPMGVLSTCTFVTVAPGPTIGIYIGPLRSSLRLYASSTGLRLMVLGLGIVLSP